MSEQLVQTQAGIQVFFLSPATRINVCFPVYEIFDSSKVIFTLLFFPGHTKEKDHY